MSTPLPEGFPLEPVAFADLRTEFHDGVLSIILDRPKASNGLTIAMSNALMAVLAAAGADPRVRVLLLTGVGRNFSAGGDLELVERNIAACRSSKEEAYALQMPSHLLTGAITNCPKPVVAAVNGAAAGMGLAIAVSCDIIVADDSTRFVYAYTQVGLPGDGGITRSLVSRIGLGRALEFAMLGRPADAETALTWGLANFKANQPDTALSKARETALTLSCGPATAFSAIKHAMRTAGSAPDHATVEIDGFIRAAQSSDADEGVAALREKRRPQFI